MKHVAFNLCVLSTDRLEKVLLHKLDDCLKSTGCRHHDRMDNSKIRRLFGEEISVCQVTDAQGTSNVPGFLRNLIGVYKDIFSPILPFEIMTEVCVLLDPPQPRANDWRSVACKVGYDHYINYLMVMMKSPTMAVMHGCYEKGWSLEDFEKCMIDIQRHDVASLINKYLSTKEE
ncbi:uncharacterized protein [Antedon mediterranea]|uniref:uncharacterized protein n=1 Tax=Antedon mediterranea TaxID=105859 RepID=UPI003AF66DDE